VSIETQSSLPVKGGWTKLTSPLVPGTRFMSGNEACAEGALAAGCRFYAGYPITPSSEIMVRMAHRLPEVGGVFIQMEDEIASLSAVIGASWAGTKSMTATSGPGFSLMMENLGYAAMTETPCVLVNVQRAGPSTGQASRPAQGDVMQARWGTHGGPEIIALAPWSAQEMYELTVRAFGLAERFRVPVIVLADEVVGHLRETVVIPPTVQSYHRTRWPQDSPFGTESDDGVPPMPAFGEGAKLMVTGSTHDEKGMRRASDAATQERLVRRLSQKLLAHRQEIDAWETHDVGGAERLVLAYGSAARSALWAVQEARQQGQPVGLLRLQSLWPFPDEVVARHARNCREVIVPEMNLGQVAREVQRCASTPVTCLSQVDGELINPRRILHYLLEGEWGQ
jgi:2-oxoglutarate ferredoxin oxidoreductase subunit alpha